MRAIQNYRITFKSDALEFFDSLKNKDAIYSVIEYAVIHSVREYEEKAIVDSVTFLDSDIMQVVIDVPYIKNYEITDTLTAIENGCKRLPYCANVLLTDDNPEL